MDKFIDKNYIYAIVGATPKKEKYGYKVLMDLKSKGFNVVPINPNYENIEEMVCYPDLISLEDRPDVVVIITSPDVSQKILKNCADLKLNRVWFQPGASDEKTLKMAQDLGLNFVCDKCIMQETNRF